VAVPPHGTIPELDGGTIIFLLTNGKLYVEGRIAMRRFLDDRTHSST
jgi:hypothetical protein